MAKQKYKVKKKSSATQMTERKTKPKTNFSVRQRMLLLVLWGAVCVGLYVALAKVSFFFSLWIFIIIFLLAFALYFVTGIKISRLADAGKGESEECVKLIDKGKILLIVMVPPLFVIIYDFVSSTIKMFM